MLESDTFSHETSLSHMKPVQCSPAMVGFSLDKINIPQHIKYLFDDIPHFFKNCPTVNEFWSY